MAINKVVYNNETLIDISSDTVTRDQLAYGITAHDSSGQKITGTANMSGASNVPTQVSDLENDLGFIQNGTTDDVEFKGSVAVSNEGLLKVINITCFSSQTIAKSDTKTGTVNFASSVPSGFTPIGIVGYSSGGQWYNIFRLRLVENDPTTIEYSVANVDTNNSRTASLGARVLLIRTSIV